MSEPRIPFRDTWPADISIRDDAALGRAWRRCEAALLVGWSDLRLSFLGADRYCAAVHDGTEGAMALRSGVAVGCGSTATEALTRLADMLESRAG